MAKGTDSSIHDANDPDHLASLAIGAATTSGRIEDIERAVNTSKLAAERAKSLGDARNQERLLRFEGFKSWAALLVPFLTLLTLALTVWMQLEQLKLTRQANDDLRWRETAKTVLEQLSFKDADVDKSTAAKSKSAQGAGREPDPILATTLLRSYLSDSRYGKEALALSLLVLSRAPSAVILEDELEMLNVAFTRPNLDQVIAIQRHLWSRTLAIEEQLAKLPEKQRKVSQLNHLQNTIRSQIIILSSRTGAILRTSGAGAPNPNLSRAWFFDADFSNADLTNANLSGTRWDWINMSGARLRVKSSTNSEWLAVNWWNAREINAQLLVFLVTSRFPFFDPEIDYASLAPPPLAEYTAKVRALCNAARADCPANLQYGTPSKPPIKPPV